MERWTALQLFARLSAADVSSFDTRRKPSQRDDALRASTSRS